MPAETHSHSAATSRRDVEAAVLLRLAELGADPQALAPSAALSDLGMSDLARIDLAESLEEEFSDRTVGFRLDDDDLSEVETIADLVELVTGVLQHADREAGE